MIIKDNYIVAIEPTDEQYMTIKDMIAHKPEDPDGYMYCINAITLEWDLIKIPDPEPEDPEAEAGDYENQLKRLGVSL